MDHLSVGRSNRINLMDSRHRGAVVHAADGRSFNDVAKIYLAVKDADSGSAGVEQRQQQGFKDPGDVAAADGVDQPLLRQRLQGSGEAIQVVDHQLKLSNESFAVMLMWSELRGI